MEKNEKHQLCHGLLDRQIALARQTKVTGRDKIVLIYKDGGLVDCNIETNQQGLLKKLSAR